ncbi:hypothetical protein B9Z19DRAFT_1090052 [Tuber borchii]|uniref:Uncharacterized protein n=1 Tax=Tuber borchii TaxID=42251 RepID=A0A2T6ZJ95_TUBBO|nr:hypothetical protein B9Z19DRAFT_1090052 [Tuber borchii]
MLYLPLPTFLMCLRCPGGCFLQPHPPHITVPRDPSITPCVRGTVQDWCSLIMSHFSGTVPRRQCNVSRGDKWVCTSTVPVHK